MSLPMPSLPDESIMGGMVIDDLKRLWHLSFVQRMRQWLVAHPRWVVIGLLAWGAIASFTPAYRSLHQRGEWWLTVRNGTSPEQKAWNEFVRSRDAVAQLSSQAKEAIAAAHREAAQQRAQASASADAEAEQRKRELLAQYPDAKAALMEAEKALPVADAAAASIRRASRYFREGANDPDWYSDLDFTPDAVASASACNNDFGLVDLFSYSDNVWSNIMRCAAAANLDDNAPQRLGIDSTDVETINFVHNRLSKVNNIDLPEFLSLLWRHKVRRALTVRYPLPFPPLTRGEALSPDLLGSGIPQRFRENALRKATATERIGVRQLYPALEAYVQAANRLIEICAAAEIDNCGY